MLCSSSTGHMPFVIEIPGALFSNCTKTPDVDVDGTKLPLKNRLKSKYWKLFKIDFFPKG